MPASPAVYLVAIGPTYSKVGFTSVQMTETLAESFYYVKSKILSYENKKTGVLRKIICFGILIHVLS